MNLWQDGVSGSQRTRSQRKRIGVVWVWYSLIALVAVLVATAVLGHVGPAAKLCSAALVAVPCLYFLLVVCGTLFSGAAPEESKLAASKVGVRGWLFAALALVCSVAAVAFNPSAQLAQIYIIPQLFMAFTYVASLVLVVVMNAAFVLVECVVWGVAGSGVAEALVQVAVTVVFSAMIGEAFDVLARTNVRNQQLLDQLDGERRTVLRLSRAEGASAERERMARDMHDTIAQSLVSMLTIGRAARSEVDDDPAEARRHIDMVIDMAKESLDDTRHMIAGSQNEEQGRNDLRSVVEQTAGKIAERAGLHCQCVLDQKLPALPRATEVAVLRIVQESLANVVHHAQASHVEVCLRVRNSSLVLEVVDDGVGFDTRRLDVPSMQRAGHGFGLSGIVARAEECGGRCRFISAPGHGTTVEVTLPVAEK